MGDHSTPLPLGLVRTNDRQAGSICGPRVNRTSAAMIPNPPPPAARIEDLGHGDFVEVDCAACHHVALLTRAALLRGGLSPAAKVLDLKGRPRGRGCGRKGRAVVSVKWRGQGA